MDFNALIAEAEALIPWLRNVLTGLVQPWRLIQLGLIATAFLMGWLGQRALLPRFNAWMRSLTLTNRRARMLILIRDRLRWLIMIALLWGMAAIMLEVTWPSRSFLIVLAAKLISALVLISIIVRLIRTPILRTIVRWCAWIAVSLWMFGLFDSSLELADRAAITLGDTRISVLLVLQTLLSVGLTIFVANWLSGEARSRLMRNEDMSPSMRVLSEKLVTVVLYAIALALGLQFIGFDLTTLTVLSGAIGLGLGFGLQKVVSNLVSGVILLLDKSIKPGDVISLGDTFGWISGLGARYVSVVTRDGREYLIPNEDLITNQVVNWSHSSKLVRLDINFGVSYDSDPHQVRNIAVEATTKVARVQSSPAPVCHIVGFGDSSIDFVLRFWIDDPSGGLTNIRGNVFLALWDVLKKNDVEIPFPRRDISILTDRTETAD
ncbi:mechanosensitive ion channel family protein [Pontivivens insulae]|uniref:Putative MscS family protein.1 n=1 Tax=Pontivivens insulae TaxID=1639689 RepID=A0A2R8ABI0_9RHOB|nr:mechanosensitive ion channel domain-containing protein [Pontivivens insulae]RED11228.1 mechanosensitive ion channel-like protein [Pontivivens insulae]SPF29599.1 putative MscS family protein.1 [Pontivivens insulae]